MPATKIGVIYNQDTKQILKVVIPDEDAQLVLHIGEGESALEYEKDQYPGLEGPEALTVLAALVEEANDLLGNKKSENQPPLSTIEDLDPKSIGRSNPDR